MRILSDFRDYYDGCMSYGVDEELKYLRYEKDFSPGTRSYGQSVALNEQTYLYYVGTIGFCGELYNFICLENIYDKKCRAYFYDLESFRKYLMDNSSPKEKNSSRNFRYATQIASNALVSFNAKHHSYFHEHHTAIFAIYSFCNRKIQESNCALKNFEFYKVFDAYSAYQALRMYWANMAQPMKPIPEISDADMLEIKGFDKYSFKTVSPGKKRKKRNKA